MGSASQSAENSVSAWIGMGSDMLGLEGSTGVGNVSGSTNTSGRGIGGEVGCGFVGMDSSGTSVPGSVPGLDGAMGSGKIPASDASDGGSNSGSGSMGREDGALEDGN